MLATCYCCRTKFDEEFEGGLRQVSDSRGEDGYVVAPFCLTCLDLNRDEAETAQTRIERLEQRVRKLERVARWSN